MFSLYPFYFIRHGETDWNKVNRIMGQTDIPLNEKGIQQSHDLKNHLKQFKFGRIWSSSLQRARQTSCIINEAFHYPIYYTDHLKERGWGIGEGGSHEHFLPDMKLKFDVKDKSEEDQIPEGAEPYKAFEERVILAFREILIPDPHPPLVVSHGGIFRILTNLLGNTTFPAENCALYFFRPPERPTHPWSIVNLNHCENT
jgi:broad specificity phosphatase PhoE